MILRDDQRPSCPRCGRPGMKRAGFNKGLGQQVWECSSGPKTARVRCCSTIEPVWPRSASKAPGVSVAASLPVADPDADEPTEVGPTVFSRDLGDATTFILSSSQNATPVHASFWETLKVIANHRAAELLVIPTRFRNPTSIFTEKQAEDEHWAPEVTPYLYDQRVNLNANLTLLADAKVSASASDPLARLDAVTGHCSAIIGSSKIALRTVAAPASKTPKVLVSTGSCTVVNSTDTLSGTVAAFHHQLAALIVECEGGKFWFRHLHWDADSGSVTDLDTRYRPDGTVEPAPRPLALVHGDSHVRFGDEMVEEATFGPGGSVEVLDPEHVVFHDLLDGHTANPHHAGNALHSIAKWKSGKDSIREEIQEAADYVHERTMDGRKSIIVDSNHTKFIGRAVLSADWHTAAPVNAEFILETALIMVRGTRMGAGGTEYPDVFAETFERMVGNHPDIRVLRKDEPFTLGNVALDLHGDKGSNGSRGSVASLKRVGMKSVIGHGHCPTISEGCWMTGTSSRLKLEYVSGPSGWMHADVLLLASGHRQMLFYIDGRWRR